MILRVGRGGGLKIALAIAALTPWLAASESEPSRASAALERRVRTFYVMGTLATFEVQGIAETLDEALEGALEELVDVDRRMSLYQPETELSRMNREAFTKPFRVSAATYAVLSQAIEVARGSDGAFDPTVGALSHVWRFDDESMDARVPSREVIQRARSRVGYRFVQLNDEERRVRFLRKGVRLTLDGVAKGYACEQALSVLLASGIRRAVVDVGESSICFAGDARTFAIRDPLDPRRAIGSFEWEEGSIASSAGYERQFEIGGRRYSHLIDPRTGWPVGDSLSATVMGGRGEGLKVDALSTAGFILGPEGALSLWESLGVEGILVYRRDGAVHVATTPGVDFQPRAADSAGESRPLLEELGPAL